FQVPCHQSKTIFELDKPVADRKVDKCPGYKNAFLNEVTPIEAILARAIENDKVMGRILWASQLIIKCPRCLAISRTETKLLPTTIEEIQANLRPVNCTLDIDTISFGWPETAATCSSKITFRANKVCK
ncbi:unnamed protein product, partial [Toxocara canis]|uniref:Meth_synt_2 domain-containing protein n=1 Tax=Toxocara canis TaxID=6265 RepID=A0A183U0A3_TOXCA